jgi:hypothetical protein
VWFSILNIVRQQKAWICLLIIVPTTEKSMVFYTYYCPNYRKVWFSILFVPTSRKSVVFFTYFCSYVRKSVVFYTYYCPNDRKVWFSILIFVPTKAKAWFSLHILFHGAHIPLGSADLGRTGRGEAAGSRGRLNASSEFGVGLHNPNILSSIIFFFFFILL